MVKFIFKTVGFTIEVPSVNIGSFRTPGEIIVPNNKVELVEAKLKEDGIDDYEKVIIDGDKK